MNRGCTSFRSARPATNVDFAAQIAAAAFYARSALLHPLKIRGRTIQTVTPSPPPTIFLQHTFAVRHSQHPTSSMSHLPDPSQPTIKQASDTGMRTPHVAAA